jgi:hypothetical protein
VRVVVAAVIAAMLCILAPAAGAMSSPPVGLSGLRVVKLKPHQKTALSCSAKSRSRARAAGVARRLKPVACEQPPRSKVLDAGFAVLFAP